MPTPDPYLIAVAEVAHLLWCRRLLDKGWTPGATFDAERRVHDALVMFRELPVVDRRAICAAIESEGLAERLSTCLRMARGGAQEFAVSELRVGLRVSLTQGMERMGSVVAWEADAEWPGCVNTISVRWDTGETTEHAASECELWRSAEGGGTEGEEGAEGDGAGAA